MKRKSNRIDHGTYINCSGSCRLWKRKFRKKRGGG